MKHEHDHRPCSHVAREWRTRGEGAPAALHSPTLGGGQPADTPGTCFIDQMVSHCTAFMMHFYGTQQLCLDSKLSII